MTSMEQIAFITIPGFPAASDEDAWTPFIQALEQDGGDLGPVLSWTDTQEAEIVLADDAEDAALFAQRAYEHVTRALEAAGLGALYPSHVVIEPARADELAVA